MSPLCTSVVAKAKNVHIVTCTYVAVAQDSGPRVLSYDDENKLHGR